jgi:hypothetical protein
VTSAYLHVAVEDVEKVGNLFGFKYGAAPISAILQHADRQRYPATDLRNIRFPRQEWVVLRNVPLYVRIDEILSISDRLGCGRATDWPDGIRTHWRSPTFTAYWDSGTTPRLSGGVSPAFGLPFSGGAN